ncbi:MAG: F0F1 ATP synthase subunit gamma [Bacteroides sp.]|nr:F0F1 ATP synthase subunit gamma [Bacteroides sp.]
MASLKEVKTRITSVQNTRKITSAMKMVASAKLHKAQGAIENMLPYQQKLNQIMTNFLSADLPVESPFIVEREVKRVAIVAFSSNSSLCGAYNANVHRMLLQTVGEYRKLGQDNILIFPIGRKIEDASKKMGFVPQGSYQILAEKPSYAEASALAEKLMAMYLDKEIDRVDVIYHHFKSSGVQLLLCERYLPIDLTRIPKEHTDRELVNDYIIEPSAERVIADLIPTVLCQQIFTAAVDSNASEHAARVMAMQIATDNANELIQELTKQYNKTRQQTITNELLDIMGGSMK